MKGIAIFVLLLLVGMGVAMYWFTRPPNRNLDAQGRAWVESFSTWRARTTRDADRAYVGMGFSSERKNARLIAPLRTCSVSFARLGDPPTLLKVVSEDVTAGCREAEYAVAVNARFGTASLATTKRHLHQAEDWLGQALRDLHDRLGTKRTAS